MEHRDQLNPSWTVTWVWEVLYRCQQLDLVLIGSKRRQHHNITNLFFNHMAIDFICLLRSDTNNKIMRPKHRPWKKWRETLIIHVERAGEETVCRIWVVFLSSVIEFFILSYAILISSNIIAYCWFSFPGNIRESEVRANTGCYNTFRYSLVAVIETGLFQRTYMNNIAHILVVGISFLF